VSLIPRIYRHTDPGAPALSGIVGSLTALLDAVLVDGYGTGPSAKPPAGWTREFMATNKRAYRNNPVTGTGAFVRVDDDATSPGNARHAWVRTFLAMTDIDTGTDPAPTAAQLADGVIFAKSDALSSAARPWAIFANERFFYLFVNLNNAASPYDGVAHLPFFAGDTVPIRAGDFAAFYVCGSDRTSWTGGSSGGHAMLVANFGLEGSFQANRAGYFSRSYTQAVGAAGGNMCRPSGTTSDDTAGSSGGAYPNPVNEGVLFETALLREGPFLPRAVLPNLYVPLHPRPFSHGQVLTGLEGLPPGTSLTAWNLSSYWGAPASGSAGQVLLDTSNEW